MGVEIDDKPGLATVSDVEIFSTGRHQRVVWTHAKLDKAVSNFIEHQLPGKVDKAPPVVLGHSEDQEFMRDSGYPKVGRPVEMVRKDVTCRLCYGSCKSPVGVEAYDEDGSCPICLGTGIQGLIVAKLGEVPRSIAKLINARAYDNVSAEMVEEQPPQVPMQGPSLRRLALVGGKLPHIKTLSDLPQADYEGFTEDAPYIGPLGAINFQRCEGMIDGAWECFHETFAEGSKMEKDWVKKLLHYGHRKETVEKMDEDAGREMAEMHDRLAAPKYEHGDKSDDDWQAHEPRSEAVEKFGEMCSEKHNHMKMRGKRLFGEEHFAEAIMAEMFSEADKKAIVAAVVAQIKADVDPLKRDVSEFKTQTKAATKRARVEAFAEEMKATGRIAPHELDETAREANPRFRTLTERLMMLDDTAVVEKFTENDKEVSLTQLGLEMEAIKARPRQSYGSKTRGGDGAGGKGPDLEQQKVELHYETFSETFAKYNTSKEEFVGGFVNNRKYDPTITAEQYLNPVAGRR